MVSDFVKVSSLEEALMEATEIVLVTISTNRGDEQLFGPVTKLSYPFYMKLSNNKKLIHFAGYESGIKSIKLSGGDLAYENLEIESPYKSFDPHSLQDVEELNYLWKKWFNQEIPKKNYRIDEEVASANILRKTNPY